MGLFDYVRSSYPLPEAFMGINQTKDIEFDISGTMTEFWIDPDGYLWCGDYKGTSTFEEISEDDPRYDGKRKFLNFEWVPTGGHGKFHVHPITKYIEIYPECHDGEWEEWPRLRLHFVRGRLLDWEDVTGR
jgi:hypothetical protein